jgi:hypothetical protein
MLIVSECHPGNIKKNSISGVDCTIIPAEIPAGISKYLLYYLTMEGG